MMDREPDEGPTRCESLNPRTGAMCEAYHGHDGEHWFGLSEQWTDAPATVDASAPKPPGEGHRTGTGGPDAPGASEGLDAAIEAAARATESHYIETGQADADGYNPCSCGQWRDGGDGPSWDEHMADIGVRAAEPILRQAVAEKIAAAIDAYGVEPISWDEVLELSVSKALTHAAEIAREVGRG